MQQLSAFFAMHTGFSLATIAAILHVLVLLVIFLFLAYGAIWAVKLGGLAGSAARRAIQSKEDRAEVALLVKAAEKKFTGSKMGTEKLLWVSQQLSDLGIPHERIDVLVHAFLTDLDIATNAFAQTLVQGDQINTPVQAPQAQEVIVEAGAKNDPAPPVQEQSAPAQESASTVSQVAIRPVTITPTTAPAEPQGA
jgi:hypothetical protein